MRPNFFIVLQESITSVTSCVWATCVRNLGFQYDFRSWMVRLIALVFGFRLLTKVFYRTQMISFDTPSLWTSPSLFQVRTQRFRLAISPFFPISVLCAVRCLLCVVYAVCCTVCCFVWWMLRAVSQFLTLSLCHSLTLTLTLTLFPTLSSPISLYHSLILSLSHSLITRVVPKHDAHFALHVRHNVATINVGVKDVFAA